MSKLTTIHQALESYGLTREQSSIYTYLGQHKDETPFNISKGTKIPRTTVYRVLEELRNIGIITIFKKNNVAHYTAENPRRLLERLREKEAVITQTLPDIEALFTSSTVSPHVKLYTGNTGVKTGLNVLYEHLEKHGVKQLYTYSNSDISKHLPKYLTKTIEYRERLNIHVKMIASESAKDKSLPHSQHYETNEFREVRFMPHPFIFEGTIILGDSIAVCFSLKDNQLHTIVLESEAIIKMLTQFFLYSWSTLK